jgi:hypothetical protein
MLKNIFKFQIDKPKHLSISVDYIQTIWIKKVGTMAFKYTCVWEIDP